MIYEVIIPEISSDGGLILINKIDDRLGLIESLANNIPDIRDPLKIKHTVREILTQRIYAIVSGHEDLKADQENVCKC